MGRIGGCWHEGFRQDDHAGVGDHQHERQGGDTDQVMYVQPGAALAGSRPQGEKIAEEAMMYEDA